MSKRKTKQNEKQSSQENEKEYQRFFRNYLVKNKPKTPTQDELFLTEKDLANWPHFNEDTEDNKIYEDIYRKFNEHNKFGIGKTFTTKEPGTMAAYSFVGDLEKPQSKEDYSYFSFPSFDNNNFPDPKTIAHEVVHANDHQIDHLTPKIWGDLRALYNTNPIGFEQSINRLRNKIDPTVFGISESYRPDTVKETMNTEVNQYKKELPNGSWNSSNRKTKSKFQEQPYNWENGLPEMQKLVNLQNTRSNNKGQQYTIPNYHFKGTFASEFPAFALTNLTKSWKTGTSTGTKRNQIPALNINEQNFLHNMLGDAENAYPANEYPTINRYIQARRNSIEGTDTWKNSNPMLRKRKEQEAPQEQLGFGLSKRQKLDSQIQMQQLPLGQSSSQLGNQFSQFGQQPAQRQNRFNRSQLQNRSNQQEEAKQEEDQYGKPLYSKKKATGGSISSGLGSLSDYINHRYAGGGGVGLGGMGRFFGLYPSDY